MPAHRNPFDRFDNNKYATDRLERIRIQARVRAQGDFSSVYRKAARLMGEALFHLGRPVCLHWQSSVCVKRELKNGNKCVCVCLEGRKEMQSR